VATYKLIQDIEAEDHILGPFTLRQFLFGLVAVFLFYMCFLAITKHFAFMLIVFVPPALFCGFFAVPFGMDQPTEIWALAKIRYLFKPRVRVWNQSGVKEMVTITAPKRVERLPVTKEFSQTEVKSRLRALADTIDSRGWAVKNVNPFMPQPAVAGDADRLLDIDSLPQSVPEVDVDRTNDVLDERANPLARQFDTMIDESAKEHRQQLMNQLNNMPGDIKPTAPQSDSYWFMRPGQSGGADPVAQPIAQPVAGSPLPVPTKSDIELAEQLRARKTSQTIPYEHMRILQPLGSQPAQHSMPADPLNPAVPEPSTQSASSMTDQPDLDILNLANNNDLNVVALAHEAERAKTKKQGPPDEPDEVVITLR
jgi:hypothetical protein